MEPKLFIQTNRTVVTRNHLEQKLLVAAGRKNGQHHFEHFPAYALPSTGGNHARTRVIDRRLAIPKPKAIERKSHEAAALDASGRTCKVDGIQPDVISKLSFRQCERENVVRKRLDKRRLEPRKAIAVQEQAMPRTGFVSIVHLIELGFDAMA